MWNLAKTIISNYSSYIYAALAALVLALCCWGTYKATDMSWQNKWDANEIAVQKATQKQTDENRAKEQEYQNEINAINAKGAADLRKAREDAEAADASAAAANARIEQLRRNVNAAIEASNRTSDTGTSRIGSTASEAVNLLTDVLQKSIERNRQLAAFADESWTAGQTCEHSYDALVASQNKLAVILK